MSHAQPVNAARLRTARRRRLAVLSALPAGLLLVEAVVRVLGLAPPPSPVTEGGVFKPSPEPGLVYEPAPLSTKTTTYPDRDGGVPRVVEHRVNSFGYRGPEVSLAKPAGTLRVACAGDSHTFGDGVAEDETWPAHLELMLREGLPGQAVEVLNFGVSGYDAAQESIWILTRAVAFQPDVVVHQIFVNDASSRDLAREEDQGDSILAWTSPRRGGALGWLRAHVQSFDLALDAAYRRRLLGTFGETRSARFAAGDPGWERMQQALREARDELGARGISYGLALYPYLVADGDRLASHGAFETLQVFCRAEGLECLDTEPSFLGRDLAELRVSAHDYHGNSEANRIFARAVAARLLEDRASE